MAYIPYYIAGTIITLIVVAPGVLLIYLLYWKRIAKKARQLYDEELELKRQEDEEDDTGTDKEA